ncbi:MAG TPA: response regulator [Terriglobales bacterium]|nr:response regulator [Terriglobales bacterium]
MASTETKAAHRILLVDDDGAVRAMMTQGLERKGFEVVAAASVIEALRRIADESFDVLISDLHMPNPGDGFTVVSAMRHSQPNALTMLVSGYPDVQSAMAAILLEADEIVVKPFEIGRLTELVRERVVNRSPVKRLQKESVGAILLRSTSDIVGEWLRRAKQSSELNFVPLSVEERTGHLPRLVEDLALRLSKPSATDWDSDAVFSAAAVAHGRLRYLQGYTPAMLVHESRILQVTIFGTLQSNLNSLDFSLVLPDVMTIADEVDAQLTQSMDSYMKIMRTSEAA